MGEAGLCNATPQRHGIYSVHFILLRTAMVMVVASKLGLSDLWLLQLGRIGYSPRIIRHDKIYLFIYQYRMKCQSNSTLQCDIQREVQDTKKRV